MATQHTENPSLITLKLETESLEEGRFVPLRLPSSLEIDLSKFDAKVVDHGEVDLVIEMKEGAYHFPILKGEPFVVIVEKPTRARIQIALNRVWQGGEKITILTGIDLRFDNMLLLDNVISTLKKLPSLFEDKDLRLLRDFLESSGISGLASSLTSLGRVLGRKLEEGVLGTPSMEGLGKGFEFLRTNLVKGAHRLKESLDEGFNRLPQISLSRVTAVPRLHNGVWEVEFAFSGEISYPDRTIHPFDEVVLPHAIIPALYADLDQIVSRQPLSSAAVYHDRLNLDAMAAEFLRSISTFRGECNLEGNLPVVAMEVELHDGGVMGGAVAGGEPFALRASFSGESSLGVLTVNAPSVHLTRGEGTLRSSLKASVNTLESGVSPVVAILESIRRGQWNSGDGSLTAEGKLEKGSWLSDMRFTGTYRHPLIRGGGSIDLSVERLNLSGGFSLASSTGGTIVVSAAQLDYGLTFAVPRGSTLEDGIVTLVSRGIHGDIGGRLEKAVDGPTDISVGGVVAFALGGGIRTDAIPELSIGEGTIDAEVEGSVTIDVHLGSLELAHGLSRVVATESEALFNFAVLSLAHQGFSLVFPGGSDVALRLTEGHLDSTGYGGSKFSLAYDMHGESPRLSNGQETVEIFVPQLRTQKFGFEIDGVGGLTISGEKTGLYDAHYFNAFLDPLAEMEKWKDILRSSEAMEKVEAALGIFSRDGARVLGWLSRNAGRVLDILDDEGVSEPRHLIPGKNLARVLSRVIADSTDYEDRLYRIVKRVTDARGLDVPGLKKILDEALGEHDYQFELDRGLKWLATVLNPWKSGPEFETVTVVPYAQDPALAERLSGVPSAREIYEALASTEMADSFVNRLAAMAHYLNLDQINYILSRERKDLGPALSIRLPYLRELKERVKEVAEHFGGLSYALQPVAISFYLDEATRAAFPGPRIPKPALPGFDLIAGGVLGPKDAAVLLRAGLAAFDGSRIVQINQRMLWDHILCQPPSYLIQVLVEMSENSPRALAAILYGLMEMDQQMLREPMDIASEMEKRLGRKVPHRRDYMAGGSRARDSYFNDLSRLAEAVMEDSSEYRALSSRIEVDYHDVPPPLSLAQLDAETLALYKAFESKVNRADSLGRACTFSAREKKRQTAAKEAYEAAFEAARLLVAREPRAWQLPEVKNFMERNGEALMVLSVVRNYQESIDDVPRWVHVRSGKSTFATEQELLRTVIDVIYYYDDDREVIWDDPLVRLLMDPPEAEYDFTLISCMGVITEGAAGPELSTAYARLAERRGVDVIRADTRTARSLEFNATKVEDAVRRARTPWGFIGYSQGCANGLRGESLLRGGTPEQQQLASTMAGRNLLFSAINGSAHGTCGDAKFLAAMTEGDRILKHYQAVFSGKLIEIFLKGTAKVLDSRMFLQSMGGITSLSHYGVANLAREGQFSPLAPTCYIRGIVEESNLPEALEMLSNVLTKQIGTHEHDTQVEIHEAVGHFVWVHTPHNGSLKECQIDSLVQSTHHWSPLHKATEFVTTQRDLDLAVYDAPKDRHVFPFVDCLARFGIIATR